MIAIERALTGRPGRVREGEGGGFPSPLGLGGLEDWRIGVSGLEDWGGDRMTSAYLHGLRHKASPDYIETPS